MKAPRPPVIERLVHCPEAWLLSFTKAECEQIVGYIRSLEFKDETLEANLENAIAAIKPQEETHV